MAPIDRLGCRICLAAMYTQTEIDRDQCDDCTDRADAR